MVPYSISSINFKAEFNTQAEVQSDEMTERSWTKSCWRTTPTRNSSYLELALRLNKSENNLDVQLNSHFFLLQILYQKLFISIYDFNKIKSRDLFWFGANPRPLNYKNLQY